MRFLKICFVCLTCVFFILADELNLVDSITAGSNHGPSLVRGDESCSMESSMSTTTSYDNEHQPAIMDPSSPVAGTSSSHTSHIPPLDPWPKTKQHGTTVAAAAENDGDSHNECSHNIRTDLDCASHCEAKIFCHAHSNHHHRSKQTIFERALTTHNRFIMTFEAMHEKIKNADGFLAALDQSGGSTPKALKEYGMPEDAYVTGEESMFDMVHAMRSRIITSKSFSGDKVLGAILFENTMDRDIEGIPTGQYLWEKKNIVPFLKCDKGLKDEKNGVQLMKDIPGLDDLMKRAKAKGMYGTKMRSVINSANADGIKAIVNQQFQIGKQIILHGLVPIIEPEVNIKAPDKAECENLLKTYILEELDRLGDSELVMLKLSLPSVDNHYMECIEHPNCVRVVALSGGYPRAEANMILARQKRMTASFSRALLEGLHHNLSQEEFDKVLADSVNSIFEASKAG